MECTFTGSVSGAGDGVTANVGGIVGANGYNSTVKANTIGSADTVVHGGMVDGTAYETARANAGGIVGTNYGTVSLTDNSQRKKEIQRLTTILAIPVVLLDVTRKMLL